MAQSGRVVIYSITAHHPSSYGAVERFVQTFKQAMKVGESFLCLTGAHLRPPGHSLTELFLKRTLRTRYALWRPNVETRVRAQQATQKEGHDAHARDHEFEVCTRILAKDVRDSSWNLGIVVARCGPLLFVVKLNSGQTVRGHVDDLKKLHHFADIY